jgi:hypothetical protein
MYICTYLCANWGFMVRLANAFDPYLVASSTIKGIGLVLSPGCSHIWPTWPEAYMGLVIRAFSAKETQDQMTLGAAYDTLWQFNIGMCLEGK